ncbi:type 3 dihydrofolate reductase [Acidihalobacter prosperus]
MSLPLVSLIAAVAHNRVIGRENRLLWRLPDDLKHFKKVTQGKPIVMGRKTYESIGRPLPGRENRIISRQANSDIKGCRMFTNLQDALYAGEEPEVVVIGGGQIYAEALPLAQRIYLTEVDVSVEGDTWFPVIDPHLWKEVDRELHGVDETHDHAFVFRILERIAAN